MRKIAQASSLLALLLFGCARPAPVRSPVPAGLTPPAVKFKPRAALAEQAKTLTLVLQWTNQGPATVDYCADLFSWQAIAYTTNQSLVLTQAPPAYFRVLLDPSVTLAWDQSPDPTVVGYAVYYGVSSRNYTNRIDVGDAFTVTISIQPETTYFFAVTDYNIGGLESDYSAEVVYTSPAAAPVPARISKQ